LILGKGNLCMKHKTVEEKRQWEKEIVSQMIRIYCRAHHKESRQRCSKGELCQECKELEAYARMRSDKCPFMETKTFCANCKVHCYKPEMREKIRQVMRFAGPRMLLYDPVNAIRHVILTGREKKQQRCSKTLQKHVETN